MSKIFKGHTPPIFDLNLPPFNIFRTKGTEEKMIKMSNPHREYLKLKQGDTIIRLKGEPEYTQIVGKYPPTEGRLLDRWMVPVQEKGKNNWKPVQTLAMGKAVFRQIMEIKRVTDTNQFRIVVDKSAGPSGYYTVYPHS